VVCLAFFHDRAYPLYTNRWADATMEPHGYNYIESFHLEGTTPVWRFALADAILEKRIWMQQGANTTYIQYRLHRASQPIALAVKALINYRDYHHTTRAGDWQMSLETLERGVCVTAFPKSAPLYLLTDAEAEAKFRVSAPLYNWHYGFDLAAEKAARIGLLRGSLARGDFSHDDRTGKFSDIDSQHREKYRTQRRYSFRSAPRCRSRTAAKLVKSERLSRLDHQLVLAADQIKVAPFVMHLLKNAHAGILFLFIFSTY
jgi:glycogen debranching enzyme